MPGVEHRQQAARRPRVCTTQGGTLLAANRNYHDSDALLDVTLPADGDYFVRVYSFAYLQGTVEYFYRLTISTAPWIDAVFPPVVEPGKATQVTVYGRNLPGGKLDPRRVVDGRVLETVTVTVTPPADAAAQQRLAYRGHVAPVVGAMDGFEYRVRNNDRHVQPVPAHLRPGPGRPRQRRQRHARTRPRR